MTERRASCNPRDEFSVSSLISAAVGSGLLAATLLAGVEFSINVMTTRLQYAPTILLLGAASRVYLTNLLVWCAFSLALVPLFHAAFRLGLLRHLFRAPLVLFASALIGGGFLMIGFAEFSGLRRTLCLPASVGAGIGVMSFLRWQAGRGSFRAYRLLLRLSTVPILLLAVVASFILPRSPAAGPTAYQVPELGNPHTALDSPGPNVVLVVLDTVRADHLSTYGYHKRTSPFLDKLKDEARVFDLAISPGAWTVPAHASMFTGLSVREHKTNRKHRWLSNRFVTLAESVHDNGYQTVSLSNNPYLARTNLLQGFQRQYPMWSARGISRTFLDKCLVWIGMAAPLPWLEVDDGAAATNCCIADWLDHVRRPDRPFFMCVNLMEAHSLYWPPRKYRDMMMTRAAVKRSYELRAERRDLHTIVGWELTLRGASVLSKPDRAIVRELYDASIRYQDDRVAEIYSILKERALLDNTVFIVVADHGESLGEHALWNHHWSVYNTLLHVPLLIRYPEGIDARRITHAVQTSDLFATVAELCGLAVDRSAYRRWRDLSVESGAERDGAVISEYLAPYLGPIRWAENHVRNFDKTRFVRSFRSIIVGNEKLIVGSDGSVEMFDLRHDGNEINPLSGRTAHNVEVLMQRLDDWLARTPEYHPRDEREAFAAVRNFDAVEALEALGYVGDQ